VPFAWKTKKTLLSHLAVMVHAGTARKLCPNVTSAEGK